MRGYWRPASPRGWVYNRLNSPATALRKPPELANFIGATRPSFTLPPWVRTIPRRNIRTSRTTTISTSSRRDKDGVADGRGRLRDHAAGRSRSGGWCRSPQVFDLDDLLKISRPGRARLSHALRRGLVDGDSLGGFLAVQVARAGRAARVRRSTSRSRRCMDPKRMPNEKTGCPPLALRRRAAHGRGDASR